MILNFKLNHIIYLGGGLIEKKIYYYSGFCLDLLISIF